MRPFIVGFTAGILLGVGLSVRLWQGYTAWADIAAMLGLAIFFAKLMVSLPAPAEKDEG